jgi:hypothetical protein
MRRTAWRGLSVLALSGLLGLGLLGHAQAGTLSPVSPQPAAGQLKPGLAVGYVFGDYNEVDAVVKAAGTDHPNPGAPVLNLDQAGSGMKGVLTAKPYKFVGAILEGLINFPAAGGYQFSMTTNDGMRLLIGDQVVLEDSPPHPERDTGPASVSVPAPGWYPIKIYFYQKQGSWVLRVKWSGPGLAGTAPIDANHLGHVGG